MNRNALMSTLALPALAFAACGGSSDEDKVRDVVKESSKTPSKLCDNLAAAPLKTIGGKDKCKTLAKSQKGQDVKITSVSIKGNTATVKGTGATKSSSGAIKLVKESGDWKITLGS